MHSSPEVDTERILFLSVGVSLKFQSIIFLKFGVLHLSVEPKPLCLVALHLTGEPQTPALGSPEPTRWAPCEVALLPGS